VHRYRIGAEDLEEGGAGAKLADRLRDARILLVTFDVDEEHVFPERRRASCRARLDSGHADGVLGERREQRVHGAGLVLGREHERGTIVSGRRRVDLAEDEEARGVIGEILDGVGENLQAVALGGELACNRGRTFLLRRALRGFGVGRDGDALGVRQVLAEPAVRLGERL